MITDVWIHNTCIQSIWHVFIKTNSPIVDSKFENLDFDSSTTHSQIYTQYKRDQPYKIGVSCSLFFWPLDSKTMFHKFKLVHNIDLSIWERSANNLFWSYTEQQSKVRLWVIAWPHFWSRLNFYTKKVCR